MSNSIDSKWEIPPSVIKGLQQIPSDRPVAMLIRHSVRGPLPLNETGKDVALTEDGKRLARKLGELIGNRLQTLHASPIWRCVQTAEEIAAGASGKSPTIVENRYLGDPGVFVLDD